MSTLIIPPIGTKGYYNLLPPFDTAILPNEEYTCASVRSISEISASGVDVYATYYAPKGITTADFNTALATNMPIIALQAGIGQWIYVPANYIASYPDTNGVPYHVLMLGVSLGAIPTSSDLTSLKESIANIVQASVGIIPTIKEVQVSKVMNISAANDAIVKNAKQALITNSQSDYAKYATTQTTLDTALLKIQQLEQYILDNHI